MQCLMPNQRHWLNQDVCTQMYALHIFTYYKYIYIHIYIYTQSNNSWHPAHTCSVKTIIQIFKCLDFSQLVYICRFCDVYSNVDPYITWIRFASVLPLTLSHPDFAKKGVSFWLKYASNMLWYYRLSYFWYGSKILSGMQQTAYTATSLSIDSVTHWRRQTWQMFPFS